MFEFAHPWVLLFLVLLPLLYRLLAGGRLEGLVLLPHAAVMKEVSARRMRDPLPFLMTLIFALLIVAAARPRSGSSLSRIRADGIDMMLALDLSGSMRAIDVPDGVNNAGEFQKALKDGRAARRIDAAKKSLADFVEARPDDRIGLIGFAELAYTLAPPTLDHDFLTARLAGLEAGVLGERTGIASPIASGVRHLKDGKSPRRVLVLFTDGSNNVDDLITPEAAAELAAASDVTLYTVGIGSPNAVIEVPALFGGGSTLEPYRGEFDAPRLEKLAEIGGGRYFHASDARGMDRVMEEINALEKVEFETPRYVRYREYAPVLTGAALLLLFLWIVLRETLLLRLP